MNPFRKKIIKWPGVQQLASIRITVVCLSLLFILTFWGTIAQVNVGLYAAQQRFFYSWFFLAAGFIPFPGAQMVLWVLFFNLLAAAIVRFVIDKKHVGINIIHVGLLTYFISAFITFHAMKESNVTLLTDEATNVATSYNQWEISLWRQSTDGQENVTAFDADHLSAGKTLFFSEAGITAKVKEYYANADAYLKNADEKTPYINASGIGRLAKNPPHTEPEKNTPGTILDVTTKDGQHLNVALFGAETQPTTITTAGKTYNLMLRRQRLPLPFLITLKEFKKEVHPGTDTARSYQSLVQIEHDGITREILIYMNNPLRFNDFTLYQASYSIDELGRERSTLAVVRNWGRVMPYISTFITFFGLALHFLMMAFRKKTT